ncbi:MAG: SPFH domain-containing protein, partial [Oscillospiraceae bacterium]
MGNQDNKQMQYEEKLLKASSGMLMMFVIIFMFIVSAVFFMGAIVSNAPIASMVASIIVFIIACFLPAGLKILKPNEALVLTLFGKYYGTLKGEGFFFVNP